MSPYALDVPGGVQAHVVSLAAALRTAGHDVEVVAPGAGADHHGVGGTVGVRFNGSVAPIALRPGAARRVRGVLRDLAPDVIHVHEPLVPVVGLAAATSRVAPVVGTFHAWSDRDRLYRAARPVARRVLRNLAARLAVSDAAAAHHGGALGLEPATFVRVPNGVDVPRFAEAAPHPELGPPQPARPTVLFVGRLERRKGLEVMVRAFEQLHRDRPEVRLAVVGAGPERERCEAMLSPGARAATTFLGRVDHDLLPGCYASAEVYVSPALGGESFGIVLLEAMAAGLPVIASDIPGYRSVLRDGRQGRLVPPGDPAGLARVLHEVLAADAVRTSMGAAGRVSAAEHDWPVIAARAAAVYADVAR